MPKRKGSEERRAAPNFRLVVQQAYEKFKAALSAHGAEDITQALANAGVVEEVMRDRPELVLQLLKMAWELRTMPDMSPFFQTHEDEGVVMDRQTPIDPCGRTYDQVVISHLYGCARLFIKRLEAEWVEEQKGKKGGAAAKPAKEEKPAGMVGRLMGAFGGAKPSPEAQLAKGFPGYGLYEVIKPFLTSERQFALVRYYAQLTTRQAQAVSSIFESIQSPEALKTACGMDPKALTNLLKCATAYAETVIRQEAPKKKAEADKQALHAEDVAAERAFRARVRDMAAEVFEYLLASRQEITEFVIENGMGSENAIRKMAPIFREDTWTVIMDPGAVDNVVNCSEEVLAVLGKSSRFMRKDISKALGQLKDGNIARDVMLICRQEWSQDQIAKFLGDERYQPVWAKLPGTFNNRFTYQHDARSGQREVKNFEDLKMIVSGMFADMGDMDGRE